MSSYSQFCCTAFVIGLLTAAGCSPEKSSISYPGSQPDDELQVFAPGIVTTNLNEHSPLTFCADGTSVLWAVMDKNYRGRLFEMKFENGAWTNPAPPAFADTTADHYAPSFSPDGKTLFFSSRRRAPEGYREGRGNRIWKVSREGLSWGNPIPLDTLISKAEEFTHSVSSYGTIFYSSAMGGQNMDIHFAKQSEGHYSPPVTMADGINTDGYEDGPYIAPDESYLIFESTRPEGIDESHDLYISFKDKKGQWSKPVNMGAKINSSGMERFPSVSPDGKYLFLASNRDQSNGKVGFDFYWIDAKVIEDLRSKTN